MDSSEIEYWLDEISWFIESTVSFAQNGVHYHGAYIRGLIAIEGNSYCKPGEMWTLYVDHPDTWDKPQKCALTVLSSQLPGSITEQEENLKLLFSVIRFLTTDEGFKYSNEFCFRDSPLWPVDALNRKEV